MEIKFCEDKLDTVMKEMKQPLYMSSKISNRLTNRVSYQYDGIQEITP
jgi:hypothetical protein